MKLGRVAGIDDGFFERGKDKKAPLVSTFMKENIVEAFRFGWVAVDGEDATSSILSLLEPYREQIGVVFLDGTIFGGSNVVDMNILYNELEIPIIAVTADIPQEIKVKKSILRHGGKRVLERYEQNPPMTILETSRGKVYASFIGVSEGEAKRAIERYQIASKLPEPLRISHLIGKEVGKWV